MQRTGRHDRPLPKEFFRHSTPAMIAPNRGYERNTGSGSNVPPSAASAETPSHLSSTVA